VLGKLASRLEAEYAVPQTATKLAQAVRDKQKFDAYGNITCAPELARRLTDTVRDGFDALDPGISQGVRKTAACFSHRPGGITAGGLTVRAFFLQR
jgi:DNA-binding IclR family transcriptional regulator